MKKIGVIGGMGHVGLVTAACLAEVADQVCIIDVNKPAIDRLLKEKQMPFFEPDLKELVFKFIDFENPENSKLVFECVAPGETSKLLGETHLDFIIVPTPTKPGDTYDVDLTYIEQAAKTIATSAKDKKIVVLKSTSPPWTIELVENTLKKWNSNVEFHFVVNPETLAEGRAVKDFRYPDRVIIGTNSEYAVDELKKLYMKFDLNEEKIIFMKPVDASLVKYGANNWLAKEISFNNEVADICEGYGANYDLVSKGIRADRRIGGVFRYCSSGYGGSCFPKDSKGFKEIGKRVGVDTKLTQATIDINERTKINCGKVIDEYYSNSGLGLEGKKICIWGAAFKANTSDVQESATLTLTEFLLSKNAKIIVYDPEALEELKKRFNDKIEYCDDQYKALEDADCLVIMTEWPCFKEPDFNVLTDQLKDKTIFDFRNMLNRNEAEKHGLNMFVRGHGWSKR